MKYVASTVAAIGLSFAVAAPLHAQNVNANNLVSVNITNVANQIAQNLARNVDIDVEDITAQIQALNDIQVPIGVAANVCPAVTANALAADTKTEQGAECTAENTTQALNQAVKRQLAL